MPNRILKDSICVSQTIADLSWFQEVFFYRLIVSCDDFGRFYANPSVLRGRLFPLKSVTEKQVLEALDALSSVGIIQVYTVDSVSYLQIITWDKHQNRRAKNSKYPGIEDADATAQQSKSTGIHVNTFEIKSDHKQADAPEESRNRGVEESRSRGSEEMHGASSAPEDDGRNVIVEKIPLNKGFYAVTQKQVDEWKRLYPAVNIVQQLKHMVGWSNANPTKRKTNSGILRFINGWLSREQNNPRTVHGKSSKPSAGNYDQRQYSDEYLSTFYEYAYLDESEVPNGDKQQK